MKTILQIAEEEGFTEIEATSVPAYSCTRDELERFAARIRTEQKAEIDRLMLEFCPNEMTEDQKANWSKRQCAVSPESDIDQATRTT